MAEHRAPTRHPPATAYRAALEVIGEVEPRIATAIVDELAEPAPSAQAHRVGELRVARGAARDGHLVLRQVRRGHARPPLLRGVRGRRPGRVARGRARACAVRCRPRVRAAALGHRRQPRRVLVDPRQAGRAPAARVARRQPCERPRSRQRGRSSGTSSNNQRMIGMSLDAGGHLTHGFRPNISGKLFDQRSYGVDPETEQIDYDAVRKLALEFRPLVLVAGYSAYPRNPNFRILREIADEIDATFMVDMAHFAGLVAGGVLTGDLDPVPHAHVVTSTTHKSLRGPRGGLVLCTTEYAEFVDKGCPTVLGGPMPHVMAAKAVALAEARQPEFAGYARRIVENAAALADGLHAPRRPPRHRRHREPPGAARRGLERSASPAARPSRRWSSRAWSPTATRSRPTRTAPGTRRVSGSARPRSPRSGSAPTSSTRWPASSSTCCSATTPASTKSGAPSQGALPARRRRRRREPQALRRPPRQVPALSHDRPVAQPAGRSSTSCATSSSR